MKTLSTLMLAMPLALALGACSQETQDRAETTAEYAAQDAEANAEVVENELREGAIIAADEIGEVAQDLGEELREDERTDPDQGDGQLDGTD